MLLVGAAGRASCFAGGFPFDGVGASVVALTSFSGSGLIFLTSWPSSRSSSALRLLVSSACVVDSVDGSSFTDELGFEGSAAKKPGVPAYCLIHGNASTHL